MSTKKQEKEYIERGKLLKRLNDCKDACIEAMKALNNAVEQYAAEEVIGAYDDCIRYVESVHAADVVEVVHREWIDKGEVFPAVHRYICSACKKHELFMDDKKFEFCPNCGAKMDGGVLKEATDER